MPHGGLHMPSMSGHVRCCNVLAMPHHPASLGRSLPTVMSSAAVLLLGATGCAVALPGTPVAREALCTEVVRIVCNADRSCFPETSRTDCVEVQEEQCEDVIQPLVDDLRLGYDEVRAGAFVERLAAQGEGCWAEPIDYDMFLDMFTGTGEVGADCTPPRLDEASLRISALSCTGGSACRIHLRGDGTPEGVCEARADNDCSHPLDCEAGQFCSLSATWRPGSWGECRPLRADGWACVTDLECASHHCNETCGARSAIEQPLVVDYGHFVLNDEPLAFLRYEEGSSRLSDASGHGISVTLMGTTAHADEGLSELDEGGSLELTDDGYAVIRSMRDLEDADAVSLEFWFRRSSLEARSPLLEFLDGDVRGTHIWNHDAGDKIYTNVIESEPAEGAAAHTIMSADGVVHIDTWHHVVLTHDGTTARLYLDGTQVGTSEVEGPLALSGDIHLGHRVAMGESAEVFFTGNLDEIAVYDVALDEATIRAHRDVGRSGEHVNGFPLFGWLAQ